MNDFQHPSFVSRLAGRDKPRVIQLGYGDDTLRLRIEFDANPELWVEFNLDLEKAYDELVMQQQAELDWQTQDWDEESRWIVT